MRFSNLIGDKQIHRFADQVTHLTVLRDGDRVELSMGFGFELCANIFELERHLGCGHERATDVSGRHQAADPLMTCDPHTVGRNSASVSTFSSGAPISARSVIDAATICGQRFVEGTRCWFPGVRHLSCLR
jgi:hypothetical protein